jgi:hypothetical protein
VGSNPTYGMDIWCVYVLSLRRADHPSKESYRLQTDHEAEKQRPEPKGAEEPAKKNGINMRNTKVT